MCHVLCVCVCVCVCVSLFTLILVLFILYFPTVSLSFLSSPPLSSLTLSFLFFIPLFFPLSFPSSYITSLHPWLFSSPLSSSPSSCLPFHSLSSPSSFTLLIPSLSVSPQFPSSPQCPLTPPPSTLPSYAAWGEVERPATSTLARCIVKFDLLLALCHVRINLLLEFRFSIHVSWCAFVNSRNMWFTLSMCVRVCVCVCVRVFFFPLVVEIWVFWHYGKSVWCVFFMVR